MSRSVRGDAFEQRGRAAASFSRGRAFALERCGDEGEVGGEEVGGEEVVRGVGGGGPLVMEIGRNHSERDSDGRWDYLESGKM